MVQGFRGIIPSVAEMETQVSGATVLGDSMFSFRMISDTRIECQNANSEGETAWIGPVGSGRGGVEPGSSGALGLDGFPSWLRQRGPYLPSLRHQPPDVLSLAAPL